MGEGLVAEITLEDAVTLALETCVTPVERLIVRYSQDGMSGSQIARKLRQEHGIKMTKAGVNVALQRAYGKLAQSFLVEYAPE